MAAKKLTGIFFLAMTLLFSIWGCTADDDVPTTNTNTNTGPTQSITFEVSNDTLPASGALCGISTTSADRDAGIFLRSGNTNANGIVEFDNLAAITYYYNVSYIKNGQQLTRNGTIVIDVDEDHTETITF